MPEYDKIKVNNQLMGNINSFDDIDNIIDKYALTQQNALPSYYRFIEETVEPNNTLHIKLENISHRLEKINIDDLTKERIKFLISLFPEVTGYDIGILWLIAHKYKKKDIDDTVVDVLRQISRFKFTDTKAIINELYSKYPQMIVKKRTQLNTHLNDINEIGETVNNLNGVNYESFSPSGVELVMDLTNTSHLEYIDIFDILNVSEQIPFIHYLRVNLDGSRDNYYKVYNQFGEKIPDEWLENNFDEHNLSESFIKIKISHSPSSKLKSDFLMINNLFSDFMIVKNNSKIMNKYRNIAFKSSSDSQELSSYKGILDYDLVYNMTDKDMLIKICHLFSYSSIIPANITQTNIKGSFIINDIIIDRGIFAHISELYDVMNYFLLLNERKNTITTKKRFFLYYKPGVVYIDSNEVEIDANKLVSINITPFKEKGINSISIGVNRLQNLDHVTMFQKTFSKLLHFYLLHYKQTLNLYNTLIKVKASVTARTKNVTVKKRKLLKEQVPDLFIKGYPSKCQQKKQPFIVDDENLDDFIKKYGKNKVINYYGKHYACDDGETNIYKYPGLQSNELKNKNKYPYLPCCFEDDQYTKRVSKLVDYIQSGKNSEKHNKTDTDDIDIIVQDTQTTNLSYIKKAGKQLAVGRYGVLPYNIYTLFKNLGVFEFKYKDQVLLPIMRYGVLESPDSFIHCMERTFNKKYKNMTLPQRLDRIKYIRNEFTKLPDQVGRQQLASTSREDINNYLIDNNSYIDPNLFIDFAEYYYGCNIFLFEESKKYPQGNVSLPIASKVHLMRSLDDTIPTVLILKSATTFSDYPFNCVILTHINYNEQTDKVINVDFTINNKKLVRDIYKTYKQCNTIYRLESGRIKLY